MYRLPSNLRKTDVNTKPCSSGADKHIQLLWIFVTITWLTTGGMFLTGTYHSRIMDSEIMSRIDSIDAALNDCKEFRENVLRNWGK